MSEEEAADIKAILLEIAKASVAEGPGFAQEPVVLREAFRRLSMGSDLAKQQLLLDLWHELFREGTLSWGYDINNPGAPFFHLARRVPARDAALTRA